MVPYKVKFRVSLSERDRGGGQLTVRCEGVGKVEVYVGREKYNKIKNF